MQSPPLRPTLATSSITTLNHSVTLDLRCRKQGRGWKLSQHRAQSRPLRQRHHHSPRKVWTDTRNRPDLPCGGEQRLCARARLPERDGEQPASGLERLAVPCAHLCGEAPDRPTACPSRCRRPPAPRLAVPHCAGRAASWLRGACVHSQPHGPRACTAGSRFAVSAAAPASAAGACGRASRPRHAAIARISATVSPRSSPHRRHVSGCGPGARCRSGGRDEQRRFQGWA